jgi:protein phosphatase
MSLVLRYAARSDRGLIRGNNQDSVYAGPRLLAVADGMGGPAAGAVASKVVIAALEHLDDDAPSGDMLQSLREAVFDGSEHLREVIREAPQLEGMGTTLTAVLFAGGRLAICHVGDSRAYLLRDGQLSQITHDDTFVQTLIDDGRITQEEANHHPQRSLLLRALNGQEVEPDLSMREARAGDRYLLCSDGLSGVVSEETIADALQDPDAQATADRLIELALRSGGPDNITVIVADVVEDGGQGLALMEPVIDGAAGDNVGQRRVDGRSAAGRAALADPTPPPPPTAQATASPPVSRRRRLRLTLWAAGVVVVLVAAGVVTYVITLQNWFVGVDGSGDSARVAVFRGVDQSVLGVDLFRREQGTDLLVSDLTEAARSKVESGIEARSADHAQQIVASLMDSRLRPCTSTPDSTDKGTTTSSAPTIPSTVPGGGTAALPTGAITDTLPGGAGGATTAPTTASTAETLEPGVDCREVN